jgi:hypothetical protein
VRFFERRGRYVYLQNFSHLRLWAKISRWVSSVSCSSQVMGLTHEQPLGARGGGALVVAHPLTQLIKVRATNSGVHLRSRGCGFGIDILLLAYGFLPTGLALLLIPEGLEKQHEEPEDVRD